MVREQNVGVCESCDAEFRYYLVHSGFNDSVYAYCDACGKTAILSMWNKQFPRIDGCPGYEEICVAMEPYLQACACGGHFRRGSSPRCPHCRATLSAERAASYIEESVPVSKSGWRWHWQRNWSGLYCIVIEECLISDNFSNAAQPA